MSKYNIPHVKTFEFTKILGIENIKFGKHIIIDDYVFIDSKKTISIGNYVHIALFASITGGEELIIDDFCAISQGVRILTATDDFKDGGFGNSTINNKFRNIRSGVIKIGPFSIIGANSVVLPNICIGEGAMVGANSVITRNLEPWGIYVGNKKIGERNRDEVLKNYENFLNTPDSDRIGKILLN